MTKLILTIAAIAFAFASLAHAQNGPRPPGVSNDPTVPVSNPNNTVKASHEFAQKKAQKRPDSFSGQCVVLPGGGNLMATPCTDLILTLIPEKGGESISIRTDHDGTFQFTIEQGQSYKLQPGSKLYEVASPTGPIKAAMDVQVQLKQK